MEPGHFQRKAAFAAADFQMQRVVIPKQCPPRAAPRGWLRRKNRHTPRKPGLQVFLFSHPHRQLHLLPKIVVLVPMIPYYIENPAGMQAKNLCFSKKCTILYKRINYASTSADKLTFPRGGFIIYRLAEAPGRCFYRCRSPCRIFCAIFSGKRRFLLCLNAPAVC